LFSEALSGSMAPRPNLPEQTTAALMQINPPVTQKRSVDDTTG